MLSSASDQTELCAGGRHRALCGRQTQSGQQSGVQEPTICGTSFFERMKQNDCVAFTQASAPLKALPCLLGGKGQVGGGGGGGLGGQGRRRGGGILWAMLMDSLDSSSLLPPPPQHTQPTATQPVPGALLFC